MRGPRGYHRLGRRDLVLGTGALVATSASCVGSGPSSIDPRQSARGVSGPGSPEPTWGVQSGDVGPSRAVVWSRSDRPSRMVVEWSASPSFADARRVLGPWVTPESDLVAKVALRDLPSASRIHYRARFEAERASEWLSGMLTTPIDLADGARSRAPADVVFVWSGDTNGQGWGIDPARGGMPAFTTVLERKPAFFVSCGDAIYADNPILSEKAIDGGGTWKNVVTAAKSHVAETLEDFRGAFLYARLSPEVRALSASVPTFSIWDDHEVRDNWFPTEVLDEDPARHERRIDVIAANARRAMFEHSPTLFGGSGPMYRSVRWGPRLELFFVDGRSFRTPNYPVPREEAFLGQPQLAWLAEALARSTATWKVIACDMPLGLVISEPAPHAKADAYDAFANDEGGAPAGREVELAQLFASLKRRNVRNVVWLTADVHYAAAHHYDPARAAFRDFDPFHEFVAGPMHATSFPRKRFDDTFGPELVYASAGWNSFGSPATGEQYFGVVRIEGRSGLMTVTLVDARGRNLHTSQLTPVT